MKEHDLVIIKESGLKGTIVHDHENDNFIVEYVENGETKVDTFKAEELKRDTSGLTVVICGVGEHEKARGKIASLGMSEEKLIIVTADEFKKEFDRELPPNAKELPLVHWKPPTSEPEPFLIRNYKLPELTQTDYININSYDDPKGIGARRRKANPSRNKKYFVRKPRPKRTHRKKWKK
jgi:hypothetical protein